MTAPAHPHGSTIKGKASFSERQSSVCSPSPNHAPQPTAGMAFSCGRAVCDSTGACDSGWRSRPAAAGLGVVRRLYAHPGNRAMKTHLLIPTFFLSTLLLSATVYAAPNLLTDNGTVSQKITAGQMVIEVAPKQKKLTVTVPQESPKSKTQTSSSTEDGFPTAKHWFVFVETDQRAWAFDGTDVLTLFIYDGKGLTTKHAPEKTEKVPPDVLKRLPEAMRNGMQKR